MARETGKGEDEEQCSDDVGSVGCGLDLRQIVHVWWSLLSKVTIG